MIGIAILGYGVVGAGVGKLLTEQAGRLSRAVGEEIRLKYVVDIRDVPLPAGVTLAKELDTALADADVRVVVETIGGKGIAYQYTRRALEAGRHVVSSNKELVATHGDELIPLARQKGVRYLYEAAVGGGIPVLFPIYELLCASPITRVTGIVNGTTNYILTRMKEANASFPAALGEARELGYLESDPSADLDGWDARRKLAILAHACFGAKLADDAKIPFEGISRIAWEDVNLAEKMGAQVKLIAHGRRTASGWTGWVGPALLPNAHPLCVARDVFNAICVTGEAVGDVMFYGRGAGSLPTASAVVGDVVQVLKHAAPVGESVTDGAAFDSAAEEGSFCARMGAEFVRLDHVTRAEAAARFGENASAILRVME